MLAFVSNLYPYPGHGGRGLFNAQLVQALVRSGVEVEVRALVASPNPVRWRSTRNWQTPDGHVAASYVPYPHIPLVGRSWAGGFATRSLLGAKVGQAGGILGSWLYPDGVAVCRVARRMGVPAWVMVLGSDRIHLEHPLRRRQILKALVYAEGIICVADPLAEVLVEAGVPAGKVHVVRNGVDQERFAPRLRQDAERRLEASGVSLPSGRRVLFLGNLVGVKGPDVAMAAMRCVIAQVPDAVFLLAGDGPMRGGLERDAVGLPVTFLGRQPYELVPDLLGACDMLLLSSRSEGMPNVVAEARTSGVPVVATDVGLCRAMLAGHDQCAVVASEGIEPMARAIQEVLSSPLPPARICAFSRSWDDMAREILALMG